VIQDLPCSAPCVRIFGSIAWYPMFLRHEIHRHLARQVGGCGVSSRSASTWVTIVITVFAFVLSTQVGTEHVFKSSMAWRPLGKLVSQKSATSASGALRRLPLPFAVWPGRHASGQTSVHVTMEPLTLWGSCSSTRPIFGQLEVMGMSWLTGSRWLQRESLAGGFAGCPRGPSCPRGISMSTSSIGTHPWDLS
jgi:hypothetical protein